MRASAYLVAMFLTALVVAPIQGQTQTGQGKDASDEPPYALLDVTARPWTGDLDGMLKRRMIRVLTTYSKTLYFVDRGTQRGVVYDAFRLFEQDLNNKLKKKHVRMHVLFIPTTVEKLIPALLEGRGDIAAANLTITPARAEKVDFTEPTRTNVSEILVTGPGAHPIATVEDLSGKEVYVRRSSSFYDSLQALSTRFEKDGKAPVKVRIAPDNLADEDILEMVNAGLVKMTIVDNHVAEIWQRIFDKIVLHPNVAVRTGGATAWMIRKGSPRLQAELNGFLARYPEGSKGRNILVQKYFKDVKFAKQATSKEEIAKFRQIVELFRKYGDMYDMDYLLMAAQGYQESRLDQKVRSRVGAIGVMQVMPTTGKELKVGNIRLVDPNVHAGVKYMRFMMNQFYEKEPMDKLNKGLFTFASYNAGPGRIAKLRKEAARRGLNPNVWFNNVEVLAAEKIGRETVQYVSNIYKYYLAYKLVTAETAARDRAKSRAKEDRGS